MRDEVSLGGNLNQAVRVGDTVRRRAGPWTPGVHALLGYLENTGFEGPRALGMDEQVIEARARSREPGFVTLASWDTPATMANDIGYLDEHRSTFERALS